MNILYIGNTASTFSSNLAGKLNELPGISVDAIFSSDKKDEKEYSEKYLNAYYYKHCRSSKIPKLNGIINTFRLIIKILTIKKYDIVHLQYISPTIAYLIPFLKIRSKIIVSTVWGSDFDRPSNKKNLKYILMHSDLITCLSNPFKIRLELFINKPNKVVLTIPFTLPVLDKLDSLRKISKQQVKKDYGFPTDKIIIACGTNLRKMQHHLEIIDEIAKVKENFSTPIFVLVLATYGSIDIEYLKEIKDKLQSYKIDYTVLSKSLSNKDIAIVRKSSDLLIQVQDHDQFSGAMLETLYAENIIITGSWLPYSILDQEGAVYFKVDKLSELGDVIVDCVNNYSELENMTNCNLEIVRKITQHGSVVDRWVNTYKELIN